jgi:hypothetical protein
VFFVSKFAVFTDELRDTVVNFEDAVISLVGEGIK